MQKYANYFLYRLFKLLLVLAQGLIRILQHS